MEAPVRFFERGLWACACICAIFLIGYATTPYHQPSIYRGDVTVITTSQQRDVTRMQFVNPVISRQELDVHGEQFTDVWIEGEAHTTEPSLPYLPIVNRLIGIPDRGSIEIRILNAEYTEETGVTVFPFQGFELESESESSSDEFRIDRNFYSQNTWYPSDIAALDEPAIFRDVRLVAISIHPVQYNPHTKTLRIYHNIEVQVEPAPGMGVNEKVRAFAHPSSTFMPMYRNLENFEYLGLDEEPTPPGTYLIICGYDPLPISHAEELATWKRRRGIPTRIATLQETGQSWADISNYIQNAYDTWDPPLEFVCLLGDHFDASSPFHVPAYNANNDDEYARVAGYDMLADICIGRLSAMDDSQMGLIVRKSVRYEQNPYTGIDWFTKGYLLAGTSYNISSNVTTMEHVRYQMHDEGFTQVVIHTHNGHINAGLLRQQLEMGRSFFLHRPGWASEISSSDINGMVNGWMMPFGYTITCYSAPYVGTTGMSEHFLRYGSILNGGGFIGYIGSNTSGTHTRFNNLLAAGIADNFFINGVQEQGLALMEGKFQMYRQYGVQEYNLVNNYYCKNFNLMGDPAVKIWTAFPQELTVNFPAEISLGSNRVPVQVRNNQGNPVEGALVCLMKGDETWNVGYTDDFGHIEMFTNPHTIGDLWITVSKKNCLNYQADISVIQQNLCLTFVDAAIDDDSTGGTSGNGDGILNPGETVDLTITVRNFGSTTTATNVTGILSSLDESQVQVLVNQQAFPNIAPGYEALSSGAYRVQIPAGIADQTETPLMLSMVCNEGNDTSLVNITVVSGRAELLAPLFLESDNRLDPGETEGLEIRIWNLGHLGITELQGQIFSTDTLLSFPHPLATFTDILVGEWGHNNNDLFRVTANSLTYPGHPTTIGVRLTGADGFIDTVQFETIVGVPSTTDPTGPDNYGYYCYDNTDITYPQAPQFDWIEIDPTYGGAGEILPIEDYGENQDDNEVIPLSFVFTMYGVAYDNITICSNGWAAMGDQGDLEDFQNYMIPGPNGPDAMLAVFWHELVNDGGHICWDYLESDGLFVIEWCNVRIRDTGNTQTFQIILYDPAQHPTSSGDGMIKYQYLEVYNLLGPGVTNYYTSVGIEDHTQTDGIQITFWNRYTPSAANLDFDRAYLFIPSSQAITGPDSIGPVITHSPLNNTTDPFGPYFVEATVYDISSVDHARLHHSITGINFVSDLMANPGGLQWTGSIPGQPTGTNVHYYISAEDSLGNYAQTDTFSFGVWDIIIADDFESGPSGWRHYSGGGNWLDQWHVTQENAYSQTHAWKCGATDTSTYADSLNAYLESPEFDLPSRAELHFYHYLESEISGSQPDSAYDGGLLEISYNNGPWEQLSPQDGGYNKTIRYTAGGTNPYTGPFQGGTQVWSGEIPWSEVTVDLSGHPGPCRLRFRFGSDAAVGLEGWYVDDLTIIGLPESGLATPGRPLPINYSLGQNYPNPFNPITAISYNIPDPTHVTLTVYNLLGQKVAVLVDENQEAGSHKALWDACTLSSGIYFYCFEAGPFTQTRKMVLLR